MPCSVQGTGKRFINQSHAAQTSEKVLKGAMVGTDRRSRQREQCEETGTRSGRILQGWIRDKVGL